MKRLVITTTSLVLLLAFFTDTACYGLATLPASQNPIAKIELVRMTLTEGIKEEENNKKIPKNQITKVATHGVFQRSWTFA